MSVTERDAGVGAALEAWLLALIAAMALAFNPWGYESAEAPRVLIVKVGAMALVVGWLAAGARHIKMTPLNRPFVAFLLLFALATAFSISQLRSFREFTLLASLAVVFLASREAATRPGFAVRAAQALVAAGVPVALYGVAQHFGLDFVGRWRGLGIYRCFSSFGHPIYLAAFLAMAFGLNIALLLRSQSRRATVALVATAHLTALCLVYTQGRAGTVAAVIAGLIVVVASRGLVAARRRGAIALCVTLLTVMAVADATTTHASRSMLDRSFGPEGEDSAAQHMMLWRAAIPVISHRPLLGWGPGCFGLAVPRFTNSEKVAWQLPNKAPAKCPHNELLHIASTAGIPTAAAWVWLVAAGLLSGLRKLKQTPERERPIAAGWMGVVAAYFFQSLFTPRITATVFPLWLALGVVDGYAVPARSTRWLSHRSGRLMALAAGAVCIVALPSVVRPMLAICQYKLAIEDRDAGRFSQALDHHLAATALDPNNPDSWFGVAETCRQAAAAGDGRLLVFGQMACYHMENADPYNGFAHEVAGAIYGLSAAPDDVKGRQRALAEYRKAIALYPGMSSFHNDLGTYYQRLGRLKDAESEYRIAIRLGSPFGEPEANLARILWRAGHTNQALALLGEAARKAPDKNPHLAAYRTLRRQMLHDMKAGHNTQPG